MISWKQEGLIFVPPSYEYFCLVDAASPSPTAVQNLTIEWFQVLEQSSFHVNATWKPPADINGVLKEYCVNLSPSMNDTTCRLNVTVCVVSHKTIQIA